VRMIERWFPCAEVSVASASGWGSGKNEKALFTWFAARPLAQAKAAVVTSLLPWPADEEEQRRLQDLVRRAMTGKDAAGAELRAELAASYPGGASTLDLFSGRAMIPLEAARLGLRAEAIDYSPVATLAGQLLADFPLRDWSDEPTLTFSSAGELSPSRLLEDAEAVFTLIGARFTEAMADFYPRSEDGSFPWGYVWVSTLPCQECGRRFPLTGSLILRHPLPVKNDPGQSYRIAVDREAGSWSSVVEDGAPLGQPTLRIPAKANNRAKSAICPFCDHVHATALHRRLSQEGLREDALAAVAYNDKQVGRRYAAPTQDDCSAISAAELALPQEIDFGPGMPAVPNEMIPVGNTSVVQPSAYGSRTYGDLCNSRQTLAFIRLSRLIGKLGRELVEVHGTSPEYASALTAYAASVLVRKLKRSTRGSTLDPNQRPTSNRVMIGHIFMNEASVSFSYDYFETGLGSGPGTWGSLAADTLTSLRNQVARAPGRPASVVRGSATTLSFRDRSVSAVVTDPPYDEMIPYSDASDFFYVWLKRALHTTQPWFAFTADPDGVQEKAEEAIVKKFRAHSTHTDHRTRTHYDATISRAFAEARRVVVPDGVVTIVFGHGDPEVWHRLLGAITKAGLVLTGSWPAKTESGGSTGSANIVTTLTMCCRPAPAGRSDGRANLMEAEVRRAVQTRIPMWDAAGLAPTDQLMASAGPAMEAVGRYERVLDHLGEPVAPEHYLVVARKAVVDASSVPIENLPLDTFDARTRFALGWARLYRRSTAPKSEARWQALAADLTMDDLKGVLSEADKGVRLAPARDWKGTVGPTSSVIDVAMAMGVAWANGLDEVAQVLVSAERDADDAYLWATLGYLSSLLPEADPDAVAWTSLVRARRGIGNVARGVVSARHEADHQKDHQRSLFDTDMAGEPS